jgi:hypothetical protein
MGGLFYSLGKEGDFFYLEEFFYCLDLLGLNPVNLGMDGDCFLGGEWLAMRLLIRYCLNYFYCRHYEG